MKHILLLACVWVVLGRGIAAFAAYDGFIVIDPLNPEPNSSVTLTLRSYSLDVDNAMVTWVSGGKELLKGYGEKKITVRTRGAGENIVVSAKAETDAGDFFITSVTLVPQSVAIVYETPESYVPTFYEGRSLPGEGSIVKFVAMGNISENGRVVPPSSLSYSWFVNGELREQSSGRGRQSALIPLDILSDSTEIKVVARSSSGITAEKKIEVFPHQVLPLFYTYSDIFGTDFTKLVSRRFEATKPFTLAFEPFYFSKNGMYEHTAAVVWTLDGLPVTPYRAKKLLFEPKKNSYGSKTLKISLQQERRYLQDTETSLNLIFDTR